MCERSTGQDLVEGRGRVACLRPARGGSLVVGDAFRAIGQVLRRFPRVLCRSLPLPSHQVVWAAANLLAIQQLLDLVLLLLARMGDRVDGCRSVHSGEGLRRSTFTVGLQLKRPGRARV